MENVWQWLFGEGRFLGIEWHFWKAVGWLGNVTFFSRFVVQWLATERRRQVTVPAAFWWLSLTGALLLFSYALYRRDSVFIFAYAFTWIPYVRNLVIHHRTLAAIRTCPACGAQSAPHARYCHLCGKGLDQPAGTPAPA
ncbi:MAG: hypothetical protein D6766_07125 [Verrucomicrobia bacterium]|nr:MAG: hypothetical protein D6766_07125 [Verrucomicrobiota bacterium]